mgnify:CR=1 FL=1
MTATGADVTRVTEDYLALIWKACEWPDDGRRPNTTDLAAALGVTPSTVSASLKRLAREGMIKYRPYGNIELTEEGERIGRAVVRRHRIIETYLVTSLGMPWDQVHDEADRLEHAASEELVDRMDEVLGHPDADPHGDPIPRSSNTNHPEVVLIAHADSRGDPRRARELRFLPQQVVVVADVDQFDGAVRVLPPGQPCSSGRPAFHVCPPRNGALGNGLLDHRLARNDELVGFSPVPGVAG